MRSERVQLDALGSPTLAPLVQARPEAAAPGAAHHADATARSTPSGGYIVSRGYDLGWFLLPPIVALAVGIALSLSDVTSRPFELLGREVTGTGLLIGSLIHAHLFAVVFRSHVNTELRKLHPIRFLLVPVLVWGGIVLSPIVAAASIVVATFWDVWHSGLQTFGLGRIYDRNAGNPPEVLRRLDFWLAHLLYAGPILAGATMLDHFESFEAFGAVGLHALAQVPAEVSEKHRLLAWILLVGGLGFLTLYVVQALRARRTGYRVSPQKLFLVVSTGVISIYCWGFNSWGEAFFTMNALHAVQYLGLVWAKEGTRLSDRSLFGRWRAGRGGAIALFVIPVAGYGIAAELLDPGYESLWAVTITVSLMHFWYDGFIWSVARKQV